MDVHCHWVILAVFRSIALNRGRKAKIVEHAAGKSVDTDHSVCELSSVSTTSGVAIKIGWGS